MDEERHGEKSKISDGGGHEHERSDEPGHLVPAPALRTAGRRGTMGGSGDGRLSRQSSLKGDLPPVEQVLSRTVSLSNASVHGG